MRTFTLIRLSVVVLVSVSSCVGENEANPGERAGRVRAPIIGDGAHVDDTHTAVVAIMKSGRRDCSGTVVGRNAGGDELYVLTAAHCCDKSSPPEEVRIGADYMQPTRRVAIQEFRQHPCYNPLTRDHDFCILRVKGSATLDVAPIPLMSAPDGLVAGSTVTFVGYGITPGDNVARRRVEARLAEVTPLAIATDQSHGRGGICAGDSGGPALITQGGVEVVAGVVSFVAPTPFSPLCDTFGVAARVADPAVRTEFIDKLIAGKEPVIAGELLIRLPPTSPGQVRDTYIASDRPERRFGDDLELLAGMQPPSAAMRRTLLRFDLSGISAGTTLLTARVGFWEESTTGPGTISVHRVTKDWDEERETWASFGKSGFDPTPVARFSNVITVALSPNRVSFDLTNLAQDWLAGKAENYGIMLHDSGREQTQFMSSEIGWLDARPWLHLCYLPVSR